MGVMEYRREDDGRGRRPACALGIVEDEIIRADVFVGDDVDAQQAIADQQRAGDPGLDRLSWRRLTTNASC